MQQNTGGAGGSIADGVHIAAQVAVEQQTQEQEDHVHDVQTQGKAVLHEVIDDVHEAEHHGDGPQDLGVLQLFSRGIHSVHALLLVHQQGGVHGDGMVLVGVHGVVDEGHQHQDDAAHDEVHGVEYRLGDGSLVHHAAEVLAGHQIQRDRAGQAGVPDDEAGIGRGDQQGVIHSGHTAHHLFGQQSADDQTEAPVQPAADSGHERGHQNGLLVIMAESGHGAQRLLAGTGGGHSGAEHQHQRHLHGESQQIPEAALGIAPLGDDLDGAHAGGAHGGHEYDQGQDDGEQKRIRQPPVYDAHTSIGEFFEHNVTLLHYTQIGRIPAQHLPFWSVTGKTSLLR